MNINNLRSDSSNLELCCNFTSPLFVMSALQVSDVQYIFICVLCFKMAPFRVASDREGVCVCVCVCVCVGTSSKDATECEYF